MTYVVGKLYKVDMLVVKKGKSKMKKRKVFDLLDAGGRRVEAAIAKKERPFYKQFVGLLNEEGAAY